MDEKTRGVIDKITEQMRAQPLLFGMLYVPEHFREGSPAFHVKLLMESMKSAYFAVAAPRGSGKSTVLGFLKPLHAICFRRCRHIVIVSNTFKKAAQTLETIKSEVRNNEELVKAFGVKLDKDAEGDSVFDSGGYRTRVLCKGAEQIGGIRGEKFGAYRPDYILVDDLEDDELVRNAERRRELKQDFNDALLEARDVSKFDIDVIGTILHDDSLMAELVSAEHYSEFRKLKYTARYMGEDGEYKSLWPERWSVEALNKMEREKPSTFAKEMQNDPVSGEQGRFKRENFRYWRMEHDKYYLMDKDGRVISSGDMTSCKAAIACDLAWESKRANDFSVIMPGFLTPTSDILIYKYVCKKGLRPSEIEELIFSMESRLMRITGDSVPIGFEKAKLEKVMRHLLKEAMKKRNHYLIFKDLAWDADKTQRIVTRLEPRYEQNSIYHLYGMGDYEEQLLRVPSGVHDDLPDAAQGLVQILKYPKSVKRKVTDDDAFEWFRQLAINAKNPSRKRFIYGQKGKNVRIPANISYK